MARAPDRLPLPEGDDDEAFREYGRDLALDGLLDGAFGAKRKGSTARMRRAALRLGSKPGGPDGRVWKLCAAAAALVMVGLLTIPNSPEPVRKASTASKPAPSKDPEPPSTSAPLAVPVRPATVESRREAVEPLRIPVRPPAEREASVPPLAPKRDLPAEERRPSSEAPATVAAAPAPAEPKPPVPKETKPAPRTGRFEGTLAGAKTRYVIEVPALLPAEPRLGLVLQFHGLGGHESHLMEGLVGGLRKEGVAAEFIVAGVKSRGDGWDAADDESVLKLIGWIRETYPVDPRRMFTAGVSFGAWMAARFGTDHPDLVAGVVSVAGYSWTLPKPTNPADPGPEFLLFSGSLDPDLDHARKARIELRQRGYRYVYRELDGVPHEGVWNHPVVMPEAAAWMRFVRHRHRPPSTEERRSLAMLQKARPDPLEALSPLLEEGARIGGSPGGKALAGPLGSRVLDVRVAALEAARGVHLGREGLSELVRAAADGSARVRGPAIRALAPWARWRYDEARLALLRIALSRQAAPEDRAAAAAALAAATRPDLLGAFEDRDFAAALLKICDDDVLAVRHAAFAAFEGLIDGSLGYGADVTGPERRAALAKWAAWLQSRPP